MDKNAIIKNDKNTIPKDLILDFKPSICFVEIINPAKIQNCVRNIIGIIMFGVTAKNLNKPGAWAKIKKWMTLAIEPIVWQTSWEIIDKWDWEIYIKDGSLGCQYEHTILITDDEAEIIM